ncbi:hypothetical protein ACQ4M3_08115 [Leptolyngbya sp. AN03gr2]|uniref:hypothetical protein n=1 Tax=unclassified Leptolyngbya TaxID=2650499 RepID=UPI003D3228A7
MSQSNLTVFVLSEGSGIYEGYFVLSAQMPNATNLSPRALFAVEMGKGVAISAAETIAKEFPGWQLNCDLE